MCINNSIILLISSSLGFLNCQGQEYKNEKDGHSLAANYDSIEAQIVSIRKEYSTINANISKFHVVNEDIEDESTEGGELKKFYKGDTLKKAICTLYGEMGKQVDEYYFTDKQLFFSYAVTERYDKPMYMKGSKVVRSEEDRFYFHDQKLIRWVGPNGKIVNPKQYRAKEKEIIKNLKEEINRK